MSLVACGGCRQGTARGDDSGSLEIVYRIDAVRPPTHFSLRIPKVGDAELDLWAPLATARPDLLGRFRAPVADRASLVRWVEGQNLMERSAGPSATAEGSGTVELSLGGRRAVIGLADADPGVGRLRAMLDAVAAKTSQHHVAAVRASLSVVRSSPVEVRATAFLTHVGTEPLQLVFAEPSPARLAELVFRGGGGRELGRVFAPRGTLDAQGADAALAGGIETFGPGRAIEIPFLAVAIPAGAVQVELHISVGVPLEGLARTSMDLAVTTALPAAQ